MDDISIETPRHVDLSVSLGRNVRVMDGLKALIEAQDVLGIELVKPEVVDVIDEWHLVHAAEIADCRLHHQLHAGPSILGFPPSLGAMAALSEGVIDNLRIKLSGESRIA